MIPPEATHVPPRVGEPGFLEIESYAVGSFPPQPDGPGTVMAVFIEIRIRGFERPFVLRFKTAAAADSLIAALQRHRANVWPQPIQENFPP